VLNEVLDKISKEGRSIVEGFWAMEKIFMVFIYHQWLDSKQLHHFFDDLNFVYVIFVFVFHNFR